MSVCLSYPYGELPDAWLQTPTTRAQFSTKNLAKFPRVCSQNSAAHSGKIVQITWLALLLESKLSSILLKKP